MASSSSSSAPSQSSKRYDVFISFRGEDTRTNFTSHLHAALSRNKIETYIDYRLEKGDDVWPSLVQAIEDSTLFLVIFSENYASSTWCLNELTKILECSKEEGHHAIPVFYKIDPSHIRKQTGSYETAFTKHEYNNHNQQVKKWRAALTEASNLAGWHCTVDRNEAELIDEIVKRVIIKLDSMYQSESDSKGLVGIQKKVADIDSLLCNRSQDVQFIGIWGMGGIGKTTLATAVFNKLRFAYEGFCFLANVREESKKYGIAYLKNKLISTLLEDRESHVGMLEGGTHYSTKRLSRKKVLLVIDDVDDIEHMENLAGGHHWFGLGSKIIITTRDKQVLCKNVDDIYEVEPLNFGEAFCLFSLNAFKNDCLDMEFKELAKNVVDYASGVPLTLKVLGSLLYGKRKKEWEIQLKKIKKIPCPKIQHVLKLSFDVLDYEEKNIFLDIACFFKGRDIEEVKNLLDACGYSTIVGLRSLENKALLSFTSRETVFMHDLIQDMAWEIVREESMKDPGKRSRLWDPNDIFQVLNNNMGTEAIEGITLNISKIKEMRLSPQVFSSMHRLKFLEFFIYLPYIVNGDNNRLHCPRGLESLPNELRLLHWHAYPSKSLPATFSAEQLVKLKLPNSQLKKLWDGVQNLANLRTINLESSKYLIELPDFSKALRLDTLFLKDCTKLCNVHPSILSLPNLQYFSIANCKALTYLSFNTHSRSLRWLLAHGCSKLKKFSVTSKNKLSLDLTATTTNVELSLPSRRLKRLTLDGCTSLTNLPYKLVDLSHLELLSIEGCNKLASNLRFQLAGLQNLERLLVDFCCDLIELPDNISLLSSLRTLSLQETNVEGLPVSIKHLSMLESLWLDKCKRLQSLPELPPSIIKLRARDCTSLETLQLTSTVANMSEENYIHVVFDFRNCVKLGQHSIEVVEAKALLEMNKYVSVTEKDIRFSTRHAGGRYPGSKVPEWFMYRTTQSSITFDISSILLSKAWGFVFCAVVSQSPLNAHIDIDCVIIISGQRTVTSCYRIADVDGIYSDHVCLSYQSAQQLTRQITIYSPKFSIEFKLYGVGDIKIKEFGVCPTYAPEYQNTIKRMELALQPQPSASGMGVGCSYDNTDEKEAVPQKSKKFILPTPPTGTLKNQGTRFFRTLRSRCFSCKWYDFSIFSSNIEA